MLSINPHQKLHYGLPCLLYTRESACHLLDPVYKHKYKLEIPDLAGADVLYCVDGWLLLTQRRRTEDETVSDIFFLNPWTKAKIELPLLEINCPGQFTVSDQPTSQCCVVVGFLAVHGVEIRICLCRRGDTRWTNLMEVCDDIYFLGILPNPTWHSGFLYCLDKKGSLGVFDPSEGTWVITGSQEDIDDSINDEFNQYLVESGGDLLRVCDTGESVIAFRLDTSTNRWLSLEDLGGKALFVGALNSTSSVALVKSMEGRIYFNRVRGEDIVSCSLGSSPAASSTPVSGKLKEFGLSCWIDLERSQPAPGDLDWNVGQGP